MTLDNSSLEGQFRIWYPEWVGKESEEVAGSELFKKVVEEIDGISRWTFIANSLRPQLMAIMPFLPITTFFNTPFTIASLQEGVEQRMVTFKTEKCSIVASGSESECNRYIQFFGHFSHSVEVESLRVEDKVSFDPRVLNFKMIKLKRCRLTEQMEIWGLKRLILDNVDNFSVERVVSVFKKVVRYSPDLQELSIVGSGSLSSNQLGECLSSTGALKILSLDVDVSFDPKDLIQARFGKLQMLTIYGASFPEGDTLKMLPALPSLATFTFYSLGVTPHTFQLKNGFGYIRDRLEPTETLNKELEKIKQSETAIFRHIPNLNTFDGAHFENLFTHPSFQSVRRLYITGD